MPGRIMEDEGARGSLDLKRDRSHAQQPADTAVAHTNGIAHDGTNGGPASDKNSQPSLMSNSEPSAIAAASFTTQGPPPLDQSWREGEQNKSLGKLLVRVAQQCYYELNKTLDDMSAVPVDDSQPQQVNGNIQDPNVQDTSDASLAKKRLLLSFASHQRDRFTKCLVLTDWARNVDDKARIIDVKVELDKQRTYYEQAENAILQIKRNMRAARVPAPNIEGAMEILATGKASWVPDLGYLPPKPISAQKLLDTMREMNVLIAERLIVYDKLPAYMREYTVANGRVTFSVKDEFEVDLSVADEDPKSQFYFIDFRLSFTPGSGAKIDDRIRKFLEDKVNQELATNSLRGCYDFLHEFVLTHKITVLRSQVDELIGKHWFDCFVPETIHRMLVVQYWATRPGPKSWIEFGINSGKDRPITRFRPANPYIAVRIFHKGVLVQGKIPEFDYSDLNVEKIMLRVIKFHSDRMMAGLQGEITALAPAGGGLQAVLSKVADSESSELTLSLPSLQPPLRVRLVDITGSYSITPPSVATMSTENALNNDPNANVAKWLAGLPCAVVLERARQHAEWLNWSSTPNLIRQENLAQIFQEKSLNFFVFTPNSTWGERSALAITVSLAGEKWWVVDLEDKMDDRSQELGKVIASARPIAVLAEVDGVHSTLCRTALIAVQKKAIEELTLGTLSIQLHKDNIPFTTEVLPVKTSRVCRTGNSKHENSLFVRFSKLMGDAQDGNRQAWANEIVRVTNRGWARPQPPKPPGQAGLIQHDLRLSTKRGTMKHLQSFMIGSKERNLAVNSTGGLAVRFTSTFAKPYRKEMCMRLREVERLDACAGILKKRRFKCTHFSLSRLVFTYSTSPDLSAELTFPTDEDGSSTLKLSPSTSNPHQRIRIMLEQSFNNTPQNGFDALTHLLLLSLPVLQAFDKLEAKTPASRVISVHPRSATSYRIVYHAPLQQCSYNLKTQTRQEGSTNTVRWLLDSLRSTTPGARLPENFNEAMDKLWKERTEHWFGVGTGVVCEAQSIGELLERVDEVVRRFPVEPGASQAEAVTEPAAASQASNSTEAEPKGKGAAKPDAKAQPDGPSKTKVKEEPDVIMLD